MPVPDAITATRVKAYLGLSAGMTFHDVFIGYLISAATEQVATWLGLTAGLTVNTYTETLDVEDDLEDQLRTSAYPMVSVVALTNDGTLVSPSSYYIHRSKRWIRLSDASDGARRAVFRQGRQKVQITYTAGWTSVPEPILHAITITCGYHFNRVPKSGIDSERIGAYSISLAKGDTGAMPPDAMVLLAEHISPVTAR